MNRKEFIQQCSFACLGLVVASSGLSSCAPVKHLQVSNENNTLRVLRSEFVEIKDTKERIRKYVIIKAADMDYPIALYRLGEHEYTAVLMRCTHQGSELSVHGSILTCPAHGSEFSNKGEVLQGPAEDHLKLYRVSADDTTIIIHLA